jgi:hypothetical protein
MYSYNRPSSYTEGIYFSKGLIDIITYEPEKTTYAVFKGDKSFMVLV